MKILRTISRYLLGFVFLVFGLNGFLHFIPQPPPTGLALQYFIVLSTSGYMTLVFLLEVVAGVLLLVDRYVPLALVILAPLLVNILMFHVLMLPAGLPLALITVALWFVVYTGVAGAFRGLFTARA